MRLSRLLIIATTVGFLGFNSLLNSGFIENPENSNAIGFIADATSSRNAQRQTNSCTIKGNISKSGERIYHVPGQDYYDETRIDTRYGERWFCSEAEARQAGWRRSRV